ncbi:MAG TPA: GNAT family N-acetyltransferase [Bacteroidales bacterium]|nr:GNAT family N-acetyltransferase [Bacteroidales bacterium]
MEYKIITTLEDFAALKTDWQRMEKQSPDVTMFSTFDYCFSWWNIYQDHKNLSLWILCIVHNNKIAGIAPFIIERRNYRLGLKIDVLRFIADGDYHDILINRDLNINPDSIFKDIFSIIAENGSSWDYLHLSHINYKSPFSNFLFKSKYNKHFTYLIENPYINLSIYDSFDSFSEINAPSKAKQYVSRLRNKINYELEMNSTDIELFSQIHKKERDFLQNKGNLYRHSLYEDKNKVAFINKLASLNKITSFSLISKEDNKLLIYNWGFIKDNIYYSVNTAFDPSYSEFALGRVMYYEMLKLAKEENLFSIMDTGTGRYPWKLEWTSDFNILYQLQIKKPRSFIHKSILNLKSLFFNR